MILNKKRNVIIFFTLITLFLILIILNITEGIMKIDEYEEYALSVENANITTVIGPLIFTGFTYTFIIACFISLIFLFVKNIDLKLRKTFLLLPIYTILFAIPALYITSYIAPIFL